MAPLRAVLLDWRGTLAVTMTDAEIVRQAFRRLDRAADSQEIQQVVRALDQAAARPDLRAALDRADCDASRHRAVYGELFAAAELDESLAAAPAAAAPGSPAPGSHPAVR